MGLRTRTAERLTAAGIEGQAKKKFLVAVFVLSALLSAAGCNDGKDRNDDTGRGERQDQLDTTSGKPPGGR